MLLGAQKCGASFLFNRLSRHPNVEPAIVKEVDFFSKHFDRDVDWYRSCFPAPAHTGGRSGWYWEASPNYLFYPHAAKRAAEVALHAKLIVLLRNPVDRAYSHYNHQIRLGHEDLPTFEEALEAEEERLRGKRERMLRDEGYLPPEFPRFSYRASGMYADEIEEWHRDFGRDRMLVVKSEDFYEKDGDARGLAAISGAPKR